MRINPSDSQVLTDNENYVEASRYAQRFPKGFEESAGKDATHIGWCGSALTFVLSPDGHTLHICVGLGCDRFVRIAVADMDVFGFIFIKQKAEPDTEIDGAIERMIGGSA